jgi:hypothetical protein
VSEHNVKTIEKSQAIPMAERKERLLAKALRIADRAADQIEDQATIAFGMATEKSLLLAGEPFQRVDVSLTADNIFEQVRSLHVRIVEACAQLPDPQTFEAEIVASAPVAGNGAAVDESADASASE